MVIIEKNKLIWRSSGETIVVEPWGENSLRVRTVMMGEVKDTDYALLPQNDISCSIHTGEDWAEITNGKLTAKIELASSGWRKDHGKITFYNQNGDVLFGDIDGEDGPSPRPRNYRPSGGGNYNLTCSFKAYKEEKFYGMAVG